MHPSEKRVTTISKRSDYFSALVLYLGVKTLAENPSLWGRFLMGSREGFIFSQPDFADISGSSAYADIRKMDEPLLNQLLDILEFYCRATQVDHLQPFYEYLSGEATMQEVPGTSVQKVTVPEKKDQSEKSENGFSKKVSIIFPSGSNQTKNQPDLPDDKHEIPSSQPIPSWIKKPASDLPGKKEPKKLYATEARVLSDIWIHKNQPADAAIVKVFTTQTSASESILKPIERFSNETQSSVEETLVKEIQRKKKKGFSKKAVLGIVLAAIVVSTATAGIYMASAKGFGFVNKTEDKAMEETITVPKQIVPVLNIEPAKEDSAVSFAAIAVADSLEINSANPVINATPDSSSKSAVSFENSKVDPAAPALQPITEADATEPTIAVSTNGQELLAKKIAANPIAIAPREIAKKEKKETKAEKATDDILDDNSPAKGFNTGIKTKQKK